MKNTNAETPIYQLALYGVYALLVLALSQLELFIERDMNLSGRSKWQTHREIISNFLDKVGGL